MYELPIGDCISIHNFPGLQTQKSTMIRFAPSGIIKIYFDRNHTDLISLISMKGLSARDYR